jgi:hypothetical protein
MRHPFWISLFAVLLPAHGIAQTLPIAPNRCAAAITEFTEFRPTGVYGSVAEDEWSPAAMYVLQKEAEKYQVLQRHYADEVDNWRFEIMEMTGGKTMMFVFEKTFKPRFCQGPNAFFVKRESPSAARP